MNIHEAVLQPISASMYCNHHAAASRHRQTKGRNFRTQQAPAQLTPAHGWGFAKIIS